MDRTICGRALAINNKHEDYWPICNLPVNHEGDHLSSDGKTAWNTSGMLVPNKTIANRDPKPGLPFHFWSVDRETMLALAETQAEGDAHYGVDNWRRGIPVSNLINHAFDHLLKALEGDSSEPHIQHAIWNLGKIMWMAKNRPDMVDVPMVRKALGMLDVKVP